MLIIEGDSCFIYANSFAKLLIITHAWHTPESITLKFQAPLGTFLPCPGRGVWLSQVSGKHRGSLKGAGYSDDLLKPCFPTHIRKREAQPHVKNRLYVFSPGAFGGGSDLFLNYPEI